MYSSGSANKRKQTSEHESTRYARHCIKSTVRIVVVSLDIRWLDLMPKHAFFYSSRVMCAKIISPGCHCICRLVNPSTFISYWNRLLTYRVQTVFSGNGWALYVPYLDFPWASIICQTLRFGKTDTNREKLASFWYKIKFNKPKNEGFTIENVILE